MPFTDPAERMAHARNSMRLQHLEEARASFERLGITPTPEQVRDAGERLLKQAQRDRLNVARLNRWTAHVDEKRGADMDWGVTQVLRYADTVGAFEPTIPDHQIVRLLTMALADEAGSPDGFSRLRLVKRLQSYVDRAKAEAEARSAKLNATVLPELRIDVAEDVEPGS